MTPVTDPAILAELNAPDAANLKPVTDPAVLAELNGAPQSGNFFQRMMNNPLLNNSQPLPDAGLLGSVANAAWQTAPYMIAGEGLYALRGLGEGLPYIGKAAQWLGNEGWLPGATRRALGGAAYGAATNPDNRTGGAGEGAALSGVFDGAAGLAGLVGKGVDAVRPQKYANSIMEYLSGKMGLEESGKSLAKDVKNTSAQKVAEGKALYDPVFEAAGDNKIYSGKWQDNPASAYGSLDSDIVDSFKGDRGIKTLHNDFVENPTLQNAHNLQSQLGTAIREGEKGNLSIADRNTLKGYQFAQGSLRNDIKKFLSAKDPALAEQYDVATKNWLDNVVPYIENPKIAKMAKGEIENPRNIADIFRNPEADIQKVVGDMGPDASRKILYSELGKYQNSSSPESLLKAMQQLESRGLGSYVTPEFRNQAETLANRVSMRNAAQTGGGALLGGLLGHHFAGAIPAAETFGALAGAGIGYGAHGLGKMMPNTSSLLNALRSGYRPASQAVLANVIPGGQ